MAGEQLDGIPARVEVYHVGQAAGKFEQGERAGQAGVLARPEGNHLHGDLAADAGRERDVPQLTGHDRRIRAGPGAPAEHRFVQEVVLPGWGIAGGEFGLAPAPELDHPGGPVRVLERHVGERPRVAGRLQQARYDRAGKLADAGRSAFVADVVEVSGRDVVLVGGPPAGFKRTAVQLAQLLLAGSRDVVLSHKGLEVGLVDQVADLDTDHVLWRPRQVHCHLLTRQTRVPAQPGERVTQESALDDRTVIICHVWYHFPQEATLYIFLPAGIPTKAVTTMTSV